MHEEKGATAKAPRNLRRLTIRVAIASVLVSGATLIGSVAPASAIIAPIDGGGGGMGGSACTYDFFCR